ncbi:MAG: hypothetical protein LBJ00_01450 [Planctomycetaceae bacterium]|nr:hypothetical protein [Planctomycetaceae bacterium]
MKRLFWGEAYRLTGYGRYIKNAKACFTKGKQAVVVEISETQDAGNLVRFVVYIYSSA